MLPAFRLRTIYTGNMPALRPRPVMTVLPVIERELRSAARQPFTYYLRLLGVAALLLEGLLFGLRHGFSSNLGGALFGSLHSALFLAIWILVPLLTADCLSRERREGTLGLLFLTPLRAHGIVVAKGLAHGLRAVSLWLAVLPVLTIPFLLGGVSWSQALLSVLVNFSAICWALAAGLLASAWNRAWTRALLGAVLLALLFLLALGICAGVFILPAMTRRGVLGGVLGPYVPTLYLVLTGLGFIANGLGVWAAYLRVAVASQLLWAAAKLVCVSLIALAAAILVAGAKTQRVWQEGPPSPQQVWLEKTFCRPILWVSFLRQWMRWKLEHNPIGWLGQRTWSGRLVTWGWFAVIISLYSAMLTDPDFFRGYSGMQRGIAWMLAVTIGMSAASSFQRERETGVLELMLVSPLGESAIIWGRLRGLWGQFLPAVTMLLGIWLYFTRIFNRREDADVILFHAVTYAALPVIGLYFSLRCHGFIAAFLCTVAVGLVGPLALPSLLAFAWQMYSGMNYLGVIAPRPVPMPGPTPARFGMNPYGLAGAGQLVLAVVFWQALYRRLRLRMFRLEESRL
jgi:ABC-type transport system involved in multi-copper enzyme maturation permease subunit